MAKEFKNKATPLMVMLNDRKAWNAPEYKRPQFTADELAKIEAVTARYAAAHASDPYAGARIRQAMLRGYILPRHVQQDLDRLAQGEP